MRNEIKYFLQLKKIYKCIWRKIEIKKRTNLIKKLNSIFFVIYLKKKDIYIYIYEEKLK